MVWILLCRLLLRLARSNILGSILGLGRLLLRLAGLDMLVSSAGLVLGKSPSVGKIVTRIFLLDVGGSGLVWIKRDTGVGVEVGSRSLLGPFGSQAPSKDLDITTVSFQTKAVLGEVIGLGGLPLGTW